jgi:hypothetical protein
MMRVNDPSSFVYADDTPAMRVNGARRDPTVPRPPLAASYHPALPYARIHTSKYVLYTPTPSSAISSHHVYMFHVEQLKL